MKFALIGAAGYVARKHLEAIRHHGGQLVAALDLHDSVGILDQAFPHCRFFRDSDAFARFIEGTVDYVSICSPNSWHAYHCGLALEAGAAAICEKPLTLHPDDLEGLRRLEKHYGRRVFAVLQMRHDEHVTDLRDCSEKTRRIVRIDYRTPRGSWYDLSWKGDPSRSGGLLMNLGIHLFDLVLWLFGPVRAFTVVERKDRRASGRLELQQADVEWHLDTHVDILRGALRPCRRFAVGDRTFTLGDQNPDWPSLHCTAYEEILAGRGFGIEDAEPALRLVHLMKQAILQEKTQVFK